MKAPLSKFNRSFSIILSFYGGWFFMKNQFEESCQSFPENSSSSTPPKIVCSKNENGYKVKCGNESSGSS